jgi:hypothetical protein
MIFETTLSSLLSHYIWMLLSLVGGIWLFGEWRRRRNWRRERRHDVICRLCNEVFRDESADPLVVCPTCEALNERRPPRSL